MLPACNNCVLKLKSNEENDIKDGKCDNCVNWDMFLDLQKTSFSCPKNFPTTDVKINNQSKLCPFEITYELLNKCIKVANSNFLDGKWNEQNVIAYCAVHGINLAGSKMLIEKAKNKIAIEYVTSQSSDISAIEAYEHIMKDYSADRNKYNLWDGSPYWTSPLQLNTFVDAIMHLIFLGITKSTQLLIQKWIMLKMNSNLSTLNIKKIFSPIMNMGLEWCKLLDTDSGWVSDNYLAFTRIMKWYYYPLILMKGVHNYVEPSAEICKWNVKECTEWLKLHGFDSVGRLESLRQNVLLHKEDMKKREKIISVSTVEDIHFCIGSLLAMISNVMKRVVNMYKTPKLLEREIKLFLSSIHKIDQSLQSQCDVSNASMNSKSDKKVINLIGYQNTIT